MQKSGSGYLVRQGHQAHGLALSSTTAADAGITFLPTPPPPQVLGVLHVLQQLGAQDGARGLDGTSAWIERLGVHHPCSAVFARRPARPSSRALAAAAHRTNAPTTLILNPPIIQHGLPYIFEKEGLDDDDDHGHGHH